VFSEEDGICEYVGLTPGCIPGTDRRKHFDGALTIRRDHWHNEMDPENRTSG
jgi:hypothetical protein